MGRGLERFIFCINCWCAEEIGSMAFMSFIFNNVFINRRRTISAMIGITLAVTLVSAEIIAIDTSASSVIKSKFEQVPYDYSANSKYDYNNTTKLLENVKNVIHVEPIDKRGFSGFYVGNISEGYIEEGYRRPKYNYVELVGARQSFSKVMDKFGIEGGFDVSGATISDYIAKSFGLAVGDTLTLRYREYYDEYGENPVIKNYTYNISVSAIFKIREPTSAEYHSVYMNYRYGEFSVASIFVNISAIEGIYSALNRSREFYHEYTYYIWIDRDALINPHDLAGSKEALEKERQKIIDMGRKVDSSFVCYESNLIIAISELEQWLTSAKLVYVGISFPAIGLGVYLGIIGIDLGMNERRREIGVLGARGCKKRQLGIMFVTEALISGLIAGVLGIFFGSMMSNIVISLGAVPAMNEENQVGIFSSFTISYQSVVLAIIFAVALMLLSTVSPIRRMLKTPPIENLKFFSASESESKYNPKWDVIMLGIAIVTYSTVMLVSYVTQHANEFGFIFIECFLALGVISIILMPISPFLLIFSITRILTLGTKRLYDMSSNLTKPITSQMWYVVNKNVVRNPKRVSSVCTIVSLAIAFGLFVAMMSDTQVEYQRKYIEATVGSDMSVTTYTNINFTNKLSNIDGIETVSPYMSIYCYSGYGTSFTCIYINSTLYTKAVNIHESMFKEGSPSAFLELKKEKKCIIGNEYAKQNGIEVGDKVEVWFDQYIGGEPISEVYFVNAIVNFLPGLGAYTNYVIVDFEQIPKNYNIYSCNEVNYLIKTKEGYNPDLIAKDIHCLFSDDVYEIKTVKSVTEEYSADPLGTSLPQFLKLEFYFSVLIITIGLGMILYVASIEREREMAGLVARGASNSHIETLFIGEGLTIIIMGTIIGSTTGLITAYVYTQVFSSLVNPYGIEYTPYFTLNLAIVVLVTIISMLIAVFVVARRACALDISEALRLRGG
ncbi:MAG: FtsX-like permease family protein [Thermoplasmata archaeon]